MNREEMEKGKELRNSESERAKSYYDLISESRVIESNCSKIETMQNIMDLEKPGFINVDFNNIEADLNKSNHIFIASYFAEGKNRMSDIISNIWESSILKEDKIGAINKLLIKVLCAKESELKAEELAEFVKNFTSKLPITIDFKWSIGTANIIGSKIKIIIAACM